MHAHIHWNVHTQAPGSPRYYTAISDYNPGDSDVNGISLSEDQEVEVIGINQYGWWWVRATNYFTHDVEEGWVPASYLQVSVDQTVPPSWWSQLLVLKFLVELNLKMSHMFDGATASKYTFNNWTLVKCAVIPIIMPFLFNLIQFSSPYSHIWKHITREVYWPTSIGGWATWHPS